MNFRDYEVKTDLALFSYRNFSTKFFEIFSIRKYGFRNLEFRN